MYIDMHCHTTASDDARATVEQYLKWIQVLRRKGHRIDGIVLTEHRQFNHLQDFSSLANEFNVAIFQGAELDTQLGHYLVYGINDHLMRKIDPEDVRIDPFQLVEEAKRSNAIAVPAHPGRPGVGLSRFVDEGIPCPEVDFIEVLNGGSRPGETERATNFGQSRACRGIGGSDAHFPSSIGTCLTRFDDDIHTMDELVQSLFQGSFQPVRLQDTTY